MRFVLLLMPLAFTLSGCIARDAYDVVTLPVTVGKGAYRVASVPVRAGGQVVDWSTTSRAEADRNYGRKMRKQQEREAKEQRAQQKQQAKLARRDRYAQAAPGTY